MKALASVLAVAMAVVLAVAFVAGFSQSRDQRAEQRKKIAEERQERRKVAMNDNVHVVSDQGEEVLTVVEIHPMPEISLRRVMIKRERDGFLFQVMCDSVKSLSIGDRVEIAEVRYLHQGDMSSVEHFYVIK